MKVSELPLLSAGLSTIDEVIVNHSGDTYRTPVSLVASTLVTSVALLAALAAGTSAANGQLLIGATGGGFTPAVLTAGANVTITNAAHGITIASSLGPGTVSSVSVVNANGFSGSVATATTTPAITLTTTVTGLLKGNGTTVSAAVAGTDYVTPTGVVTLTNKTLTAPIIATIVNGAATLTLPATTDTLVGRATTDTLTNKTLTTAVLNTPDINGGTADSLTAFSLRNTSSANDVSIVYTGSLTGNRTITLNTGDANRSITLQGTVLVDLNGSLTISRPLVVNGTAPLTFTTVGAAVMTVPALTDTLVSLTSTGTLTNKTLTAPVIATIVNGAATLTLPVTTDTLVGQATADTLTNKTISGAVSVSSVGSLGYAVGAGGTVAQATSKATGVTLNKLSGQITMNAAALAAATNVTFTVTNSTVGALDTIIVQRASGGTGNAYAVVVDAVAAGSFNILVRNNSGGSLSEALVLNYNVIKGQAT